MDYEQKVNYLMENHRSEWTRVYYPMCENVEDSLGMKCVCGRLATGLHFRNCNKLKKRIIKLTFNELKSLLPKD